MSEGAGPLSGRKNAKFQVAQLLENAPFACILVPVNKFFTDFSTKDKNFLTNQKKGQNYSTCLIQMHHFCPSASILDIM